MAPKRKGGPVLTRGDSTKKFCGAPCPLNNTEPPTKRQIIQYSYHLKNIDHKMKDWAIAKLIRDEVVGIWTKINSNLPLKENYYISKMVHRLCFEKAKGKNWKQKKSATDQVEDTIDNLFDIAACMCSLPTLPCNDKSVKCVGCEEDHIVCHCVAEKKCPVEDRLYLRDQRSKVGPRGSFQLGRPDKLWEEKERKRLDRQLQDNRARGSSLPLKPTSSTAKESSHSSSVSSEQSEPERASDQYFAAENITPYSILKTPRFAMELIRGDVSSRLGASLANALLLDLQSAHLLNFELPINTIYLDKNKLNRQKTLVKDISTETLSQVSAITCIGVDGKVDNETLLFREVEVNGEKKLKQDRSSEHHLTFTLESGDEKGTYLTHRNLPLKGATGRLMADTTYSVLDEYESVDSIKAVLCDNTSSNTGGENGLVACLEQKIGRKLHVIGCSLHQNELPFRAVFKSLDGATKSPTAFSGPLGKLCGENIQDLPQIEFEAIPGPLEDIEPDIFNDLSMDQKLLHAYTKGIMDGHVEDRYAQSKIGPLNQARWLTLAIRLMAMYTRQHCAEEHRHTLKQLVTFIVQVYSVTWFKVKKDGQFHNQADYLYFSVQQIKKQPDAVKATALNNLKYNAFALLPENVLYSMLMSDDLDIRETALKKILLIRKGKSPVKRLKKITQINPDAGHWSQLIDLDQHGVCEPGMCAHFSDEELQNSLLTGVKLELPILPSHSQSVERCVKLVSDASHQVYGLEARHRHINATVLSRKVRPTFESKSSYVQVFDDIL